MPFAAHFAMLRTTLRLPVKTLAQPDETTCGPTCLHAIYSYLGKTELLDTIIDRTHKLENGGGTFARQKERFGRPGQHTNQGA